MASPVSACSAIVAVNPQHGDKSQSRVDQHDDRFEPELDRELAVLDIAFTWHRFKRGAGWKAAPAGSNPRNRPLRGGVATGSRAAAERSVSPTAPASSWSPYRPAEGRCLAIRTIAAPSLHRRRRRRDRPFESS